MLIPSPLLPMSPSPPLSSFSLFLFFSLDYALSNPTSASPFLSLAEDKIFARKDPLRAGREKKNLYQKLGRRGGRKRAIMPFPRWRGG